MLALCLDFFLSAWPVKLHTKRLTKKKIDIQAVSQFFICYVSAVQFKVILLFIFFSTLCRITGATIKISLFHALKKKKSKKKDKPINFFLFLAHRSQVKKWLNLFERRNQRIPFFLQVFSIGSLLFNVFSSGS